MPKKLPVLYSHKLFTPTFWYFYTDISALSETFCNSVSQSDKKCSSAQAAFGPSKGLVSQSSQLRADENGKFALWADSSFYTTLVSVFVYILVEFDKYWDGCLEPSGSDVKHSTSLKSVGIGWNEPFFSRLGKPVSTNSDDLWRLGRDFIRVDLFWGIFSWTRSSLGWMNLDTKQRLDII